MNIDNNKKVLAGPISLDAWFTAKGDDYRLHVHIGCDEHRFGEEPESPVRFKLRIREAELVVIIPEAERDMIICNPSDVYRGTVAKPKKQTQKSVRQRRSKQRTKVGVTVKSTGASIAGESLGGESNASQESGWTDAIQVTHKIVDQASYAWKIKAQLNEHLDGTPWDANKVPLLTVSLRGKKRDDLGRTIRLELRCYKENLLFDDVELKNGNARALLESNDAAQRRRVAAAESYLRHKLMELFGHKISEPQMAEPFSRLLLGQLPLDVKVR